MVYANPPPRSRRVFRRPALPNTRYYHCRARTSKQWTNSVAQLRQTLQSLLTGGDLPAGVAGETG